MVIEGSTYAGYHRGPAPMMVFVDVILEPSHCNLKHIDLFLLELYFKKKGIFYSAVMLHLITVEFASCYSSIKCYKEM